MSKPILYHTLMRIIVALILSTLWLTAFAQEPQKPRELQKLEKGINKFFDKYKPKDDKQWQGSRMTGYEYDFLNKTLKVNADEGFARQPFTVKTVDRMYDKLKKRLPYPYNLFRLQLSVAGTPVESMINNSYTITQMDVPTHHEETRTRQKSSKPWTMNMSKPMEITGGLQNRHISLWQSHGRYYDQTKGVWKWQRPHLFGTTEDLYTQTIVVPYLIPMLENAGAVVFTPRERDWQKNEVIVDNDNQAGSQYYVENNNSHDWTTAPGAGFRNHPGNYQDNENPFEAGTVRMAKATSKKTYSTATYVPNIPEDGRYAVYVSYKTMGNSVDDAHYIVYHKGQETHFHVNQQMGGGTWVYLGSFNFDKGYSEFNKVVVTNESDRKGVVTTDAVRFGGGMGNIVRGGTISGYPRSLEGARYYAQWAGAPYSVYSPKDGQNDYTDDIYVRPQMTNWLAGGTRYAPDTKGGGVPFELSLAVHSDAGARRDRTLVGTLSISTTTTEHNGGLLGDGSSREKSRNFSTSLFNGINTDLTRTFGRWQVRAVWDKNYAETRLPAMPSAIIEILSHQNFPDMKMGQDPNFKFTLARSMYKTMLRFLAEQNNTSYVVQPLPPTNFRIEMGNNGKATLRWDAVADAIEPSAYPSSYNVYTAMGRADFDNGQNVKGNSMIIQLQPGMQYNFRVTAANKGGESFPTETLSAYYNPQATATVLVVNGFHRLAAPAVRENDYEQGFDFSADPGITYGKTAGWAGRQTCYDIEKIGLEGEGSLGYGENNWAGIFFAGNTFDYTAAHTAAIAGSGIYNVVSCSSTAVEQNLVNINRYRCVDLLLGLEKEDGHSLVRYKSINTAMRNAIASYLRSGGRMLVSGSYIGSDMKTDEEKSFLESMLKMKYSSTYTNTSENANGLGMSFQFFRNLNERHYAATHPEVISPVSQAFCAMQYDNGMSAAVAYGGQDYKTFVMGFPFECIKDPATRQRIMQGILSFLMK